MYSVDLFQMDKAKNEIEACCRQMNVQIEKLADLKRKLKYTCKGIEDEIIIALAKSEAMLIVRYKKMLQMKNAIIFILNTYQTVERRIVNMCNEEIVYQSTVKLVHNDLYTISENFWNILRR